MLGQTVGGGDEDFGGAERSHSRLQGQVFFLFIFVLSQYFTVTSVPDRIRRIFKFLCLPDPDP